jgi:hypothetical protein
MHLLFFCLISHSTLYALQADSTVRPLDVFEPTNLRNALEAHPEMAPALFGTNFQCISSQLIDSGATNALLQYDKGASFDWHTCL